MHPLRIAFLWHFHQPDYRSRKGFALPWVRLHAAKDYSWLPSLISEFPSLKHTFNIVPSLIDQFAAYANGAMDTLQLETQLLLNGEPPAHPETFARALTVLNSSHMITHPHHDALHHQASGGRWQTWMLQEWTDLAVWYHLAWCNPQLRRDDALVKGLLGKGQAFTKSDLHALMQTCLRACEDVVPTLRRLYHNGRIDLSVTPYHHPILPLLCNTNSTREALPNAELPSPPFAYPDDASQQIAYALDCAKYSFDADLHGMWPPEGSISNEVLRLFARHGVRWVASDEGVLKQSLGDAYTPTAKYRAWTVGAANESVSVLFRDRALSDSIGFTYSAWEAEAAADDFVRMLEERRRLIVQNEGEDALLDSVVSVILDGENCWEFYPDNGEPFLKALCARLSDTTRYDCIGMNEASHPTRSLPSIVAGSWIGSSLGSSLGSSFDVWIGSPLKNLAWSLLRDARTALAHTPEQSETSGILRTNASVWDDMLSAESSDWFWWYDDRHDAPNKRDFDTLFRERLTTIFDACGVQPSTDLSKPLYDLITPMHSAVQADVQVSFGSVAMHTSSQIVRSISLEPRDAWERIAIRLERRPQDVEQVTITLRSDGHAERRARINSDGLSWRSEHSEESMQWEDENTVVIYVKFGHGLSAEIAEEGADGQLRSASIALRT